MSKNAAEKKAQKAPKEPTIEEAPLEAYPPQAVQIQDEDFLIRACDGDHEYIWIAEKRAKTYKVTEVYPGLAEPDTHAREATEPVDLVVGGRFKHLSDILEALTEAVFHDTELEDGDKAPPNRQLRAVN